MKCYELDQLAVKFERHLVAEIVDFQMITEDYSKMVFLCADRSVHFHAKPGAYHKIRTPKQGRDLAYSPNTCDLVIVGSTSEIYRVNLEQVKARPSSSIANACACERERDISCHVQRRIIDSLLCIYFCSEHYMVQL